MYKQFSELYQLNLDLRRLNHKVKRLKFPRRHVFRSTSKQVINERLYAFQMYFAKVRKGVETLKGCANEARGASGSTRARFADSPVPRVPALRVLPALQRTVRRALYAAPHPVARTCSGSNLPIPDATRLTPAPYPTTMTAPPWPVQVMELPNCVPPLELFFEAEAYLGVWAKLETRRVRGELVGRLVELMPVAERARVRAR